MGSHLFLNSDNFLWADNNVGLYQYDITCERSYANFAEPTSRIQVTSMETANVREFKMFTSTKQMVTYISEEDTFIKFNVNIPEL